MCECTAVSLQRVGIQAIAITVAVTIFTIRHVVSPRMIVYFLRGTYPFIPDRAMSRPYDQGPLIRLHVAAHSGLPYLDTLEIHVVLVAIVIISYILSYVSGGQN